MMSFKVKDRSVKLFFFNFLVMDKEDILITFEDHIRRLEKVWINTPMDMTMNVPSFLGGS